MYFEMQQIVRDDGGTVVHTFPSMVSAVSDKVRHRGLAANWDMDGDRCIDRWWFA
jgi:peptide/nickel transport system substrate-binding protein